MRKFITINTYSHSTELRLLDNDSTESRIRLLDFLSKRYKISENQSPLFNSNKDKFLRLESNELGFSVENDSDINSSVYVNIYDKDEYMEHVKGQYLYTEASLNGHYDSGSESDVCNVVYSNIIFNNDCFIRNYDKE